jgi:hypothetical protein
MNLDQPYKTWNLLPDEVKAYINYEVGMPYELFELRNWLAWLAFIGSPIVLAAVIWLKVPLVISFLAVPLFFLAVFLRPRQAVYQAFYYRLQTAEGLISSICSSTLERWVDPPQVILEACHYYLRSLGDSVNIIGTWKDGEQMKEEIARKRLLKLTQHHRILFGIGLASNSEALWYMKKNLVGG